MATKDILYKDDIVEITAANPKLLNFKDVIVISDRLACVHSNHKKEENERTEEHQVSEPLER